MNTVGDHRLQRLFEAQSIAIVGASANPDSFGRRVMNAVASGAYTGEVYWINPRYDSIEGQPCYKRLQDLNVSPDLVILAVGSRHIEAALQDCIETKCGGAVIFDDCIEDGDPGLLDRLKKLVKTADFPVCGGNGMGFFNVSGQRLASYYPAGHLRSGGISLIAHSGSVFTVLALSDARYRFDLVVSPGQEIGATLDEYIDYAVTRPTTKVIAVFMESARNPHGFIQALSNAQKAQIPVIICKVGRTEESANMAHSHTGALAGTFEAYKAVFDRYGVITVDTVDQLMNTALLFSQGRPIPQGGLAAVTDSGGLREVAIDRSQQLGVQMTPINETLKAQLKAILPPSLEPSNPLDCLSELAEGYENIFIDALSVFNASDSVAIIGFECDLQDDFVYASELLDLVKRLTEVTHKPCFFYSSFAQANNHELAQTLADLNIPLLNGLDEMLVTTRNLMQWRDSVALPDMEPAKGSDKSAHWQKTLADATNIDEHTALSLLQDFDIPTISSTICTDLNAVQKAADGHYPVVLKTAEEGIHHKSDVGGVVVNIQDEAALTSAYEAMAAKLGTRVIVQPMVPAGIELAFGCVMDVSFGPLVMVGSGGTLVEILKDQTFFLPPIDSNTALKIIESLSINTLLDGVRGKPASDKQALAQALASFSTMCAQLQGSYSEIDINPIIVSDKGVIAVDALVITEKSAQ